MQLAALPLASEDAETTKQQIQLAGQLDEAANNFERMLGELALRREDSPLTFPPILSVEEIQDRLNEKELMLTFVVMDRKAYAIMVSNKHKAIWKVPSILRVKKGMASLLREFGMAGDASTLGAKQLASDKWKQIARKMMQEIVEPQQRGFWNKFDDLVIVPDAALWYLPFEALLVEDSELGEMPLVSAMRVRYAPTMALATPDRRRQVREPRTAVVAGQLFPRDKSEVSRELVEELGTVVNGLTVLPKKLPAASGLLRSAWDRMVVFDDLNNLKGDYYQWAPASLDRGRPGASLARWMHAPWGGPLEVFLPGFHSAAENGLRKSANGDEVFQAVMGLMASGSRTILLSRWRTGGQISYDLMREHLQESQSSSAAEAWQRAIQVVRETEINPSWEPRITAAGNEGEPLLADHPFFWSGYLLCDRGNTPAKVMPATVEPVEKPQLPEGERSVP